jgi:hypothetical protein
MSDEQRKDDEVEGHGYPPKYGADDEAKDEVEGHGAFPPKYGANDEAGEDDENDFEAHMARYPNVRMD